ncbi:FAD-dependent oxidoreductase [Streptomyces sp. NPDC002851]
MDADQILRPGSASGALVQDLLPPGATPPLMHSSGLALVTERAESVITRQVLRAPNGAGFCSVHLVPLAMPNQQYVGSTNLVTCRPTIGPDLGSSHRFLHRVCQQLDRGLAASSIRTWLYGVRAIALDGYPLIGGCSIDGLVFATGAYRGGFSCSPVIARHLVDGILGNPVADGRFDWFIPERAPIQTMTIDTAAAEAAVNVADGEDPAYDRESVTEEARRRTLRMYESLDNPIALGPELSTAFTDRAVPEDLARLQSYLRAARDHHPQPWPTSPEPARV